MFAVAVAFAKIAIVCGTIVAFECEILDRCGVLIVEDPGPDWPDEGL